MSWWPFSSSASDAAAPRTQSAPQLKPSEALSGSVPHSIPPPQSDSSPSSAQPPTAPHDPDFYAAHPHLAPPSFSTSSSSTSTKHTTSDATSTSTQSSDPPALDPHLPHTMSCRAAFDSAFYCSSLGGHFNDIYRYGQLRSCSEHWNDFWFCMRVKNSYNPREVKEQMVQERYREKEERLRSGPNSEDVWRRRGGGGGGDGGFRGRRQGRVEGFMGDCIIFC